MNKGMKVLLIIIILVIVGGGVLSLFFVGFSSFAAGSVGMPRQMSTKTATEVGLAVGGAKDINNFKQNIVNDFMPIETDMTYEGLFYGYYFDTGEAEQCYELFCPSYTYAVTKDPFSKNTDYYLSVGLNSGITDFKRKKLNLVVVLDISGSMGEVFNSYYYDSYGNRVDNTEQNQKKKIEIAEESIVAMLDHLNSNDSFGLVTFETTASIVEPFKRVSSIDMEELKSRILGINEAGSTDMSAGMRTASGMFTELLKADQSEYENRIIFLTDAMPNTGDISETGLLGMAKANSDAKLYTTFIGIGVDFNTMLIENITKIRGANYYSVHSSEDFKKRMDDEFDYMVTPLVFNVLLKLDATGYEIEKVYGSPEANEATGELMKVNTLFPSEKTEEGTKGGIVILKLKKLSSEGNMKLRVSYEDREGIPGQSEESVVIGNNQPEFFENSGIRKGILLSRYADVMKNWVKDERTEYNSKTPVRPCVNYIDGIPVPVEREYSQLGEWERQSMPLQVSDSYKAVFRDFKTYFESEMNAVNDTTLKQEADILEKLISV
jgi:Ca-activated chloride channel family protein